MKPRRLRDIAQAPAAKRPEIVADGLRLLAEHASAMFEAAAELRGGAPGTTHVVGPVPAKERAARLLDAIVVEEAGAFFILADMARTSLDDTVGIGVLAKRFTDHLAKGVYAQLAPQGLASIPVAQSWADRLRDDRYLDGPNDVDFVFRNDILAAREDPMYVDYVELDGTHLWISPSESWSTTSRDAVRALTLLTSLDALGLASPAGVLLLRECWKGHEALWAKPPQPSAGAPSLNSLNKATVAAFCDAGLTNSSYGEEDGHNVIADWSIPLKEVDVTIRPVPDAEVARRRAAWAAAQAGSYGESL